MTTPRHVAVIDIGKTNAKLALVDLATRTELTALKQPNRVKTDGVYPHFDIDAIWSFILDGLGKLGRDYPVGAISVTTHGATAALVDEAGELVLPVLDYEYDGPDRLRHDYDTVRPPFAETGSPALPIGLNLGAQIFWLRRSFPEEFDRTSAILMYPQFWARRLTGVEATEVTSLGCHTDLWNPHSRDFSSLVDRMDCRSLFPRIRPADAVLGTIWPEVAARTDLAPSTPVTCGIHDSNASLLPHLIDRRAPFAVVSTGTWVIAMAVGGRAVTLDPARDTLINVNVHGEPVPSARFMGGREFDTIMAGADRSWTDSDLRAVLAGGTMLLPAVQQGSGPYPDRNGNWVGPEPHGGERFVAASFYLALMTATCLDLAGADGNIVVEGPFAANDPYLMMLASATKRPVTGQVGQGTGTSIGAANLIGNSAAASRSDPGKQWKATSALQRYARDWADLIDG
ncbi:MAG: FGGY-family carbohydrate kinase [Rhizobiaceae bacterium]|nr:FGGY-family carbohydrate kinase [Rhizobiaceae bacterium]